RGLDCYVVGSVGKLCRIERKLKSGIHRLARHRLRYARTRNAVRCDAYRSTVHHDLYLNYGRSTHHPTSNQSAVPAECRTRRRFFKKAPRGIPARRGLLRTQFIDNWASLCNRANDEKDVALEYRTRVPTE